MMVQETLVQQGEWLLLLAAEYPLVINLHCAPHCSNLVVVKSLQVTCLQNMLVIGNFFLFFAAHPKTNSASDSY